MCKLCDAGLLLDHSGTRRRFLKISTATAVASTGLGLFAPRPARADDNDARPEDSGAPGRRYLIRGGAVMSMDPAVGDFPQGDVLVEGRKILVVGPNL
ncbi:MAG: twin-arginine translocation signal domain-containing protein, partial [Rhizobacter sp.]|nr:twin-arginine translocation signal domain-containing protein [Rhizobacter sp.]